MQVWPNPKYFDSPNLPLGELQRLLRSKAVLLPGVEVVLVNEKTGERQTWKYDDGLRGYLLDEMNGSELLIPLFEGERFADSRSGDDTFAEGEGASWVVAWSEEGSLVRESYVNLIPTPAGGTHESGLRDGLYQAVKSFVELHNLQPKGVKLLAEDVFARVSFVLSAKVLDPQFQGQIKERLNSRDAVKLVSSFSRPALELWLNQHVEHGKKLAELVIKQAQARTRAGQKVEKRKSSGVAVLPGKLTDCETEDIARNELFLVEGDSAGGSAKMGRDKEYQAILPLRGKVLNVEKARYDKLLSSEQIVTLVTALGCGIGKDDYNLDKLRYHRIIIMTDADVDGAHIRTLLLTFFYRQMPEMVERGYVYIAQPPLYKIKAGKDERYLKDDAELNAHMLRLALQGSELVPSENAAAISGDALGELARSYLLSQSVIDRLSRLYDPAALEAIMDGVAIDLSSEASTEASAKALHAALHDDALKNEVRVVPSYDAVREQRSLRVERAHHGNVRVSVIDEEFQHTADYQQLVTTANTFKGLIGEGAVIKRGERSMAVKDFKSAMKWLLADAERNVSKQRYKGLGEMNPEQLWETTMDPNVRRLLRVQIEDAIAADGIFTTLMGDEVEPRRAFIESNALRAGNIDV